MLSDQAFTRIAQARNLAFTVDLVRNFQDWTATVGIVDGGISAVQVEDTLVVMARGEQADRLKALLDASNLAEVETL